MRLKRPTRKQPAPDELRDELLRFIQTHFYAGQPVAFAKDTRRLLEWVVLKLAVYLDDKAVFIPTARYLDIMKNEILMPALQCGDTGNITYLPAWLGKVVESHLKIHGEDYYNEGKAERENIHTYLAGALKAAQAGIQGRSPIQEMATAARLLKTKKTVFKRPSKDQLSLF
jgi:hypothetical protein